MEQWEIALSKYNITKPSTTEDTKPVVDKLIATLNTVAKRKAIGELATVVDVVKQKVEERSNRVFRSDRYNKIRCLNSSCGSNNRRDPAGCTRLDSCNLHCCDGFKGATK